MERAAGKISIKTQKPRFLIEEKIASILLDSYYIPQKQSENGAFFIDNSNFAANIKILGLKLGIHPNSLNKDFRHHNIKCVQKFPKNKSINLVDAGGWKIYQHSNNIFSLENILKRSTNIVTKWEKDTSSISVKKKIQKEKISQTFENTINEKNVKIEERPDPKLFHKTINLKTSNINEHSSEEEDNYLFFIP